jgi:nitrite reductase/ring-hydroxylating ferredoxin subunit
MARRDFLGKSALIATAGALLFALVGMLRLPKAAVLPSPSKKFRVTLPESLAEGEPFVPRGRSTAIFRDSGGVYAISTICTHLGCVIRADAEGFHCPCHGSEFGPSGKVVKGPAPKALPWLAVKKSGEGEYMIDEGTLVAPETRTEA